MFVYLVTNTSTNEYDRSIAEGARKLRHLSDEKAFKLFREDFFVAAKRHLSSRFDNTMMSLRSWELRAFRLPYLLAKLTQYIDACAYGTTGAAGSLSNYIEGEKDIEHILPENPSDETIAEFKLGNLALLERTVNQALGNKPYSQKVGVYSQSLFLPVKCQASKPLFGVADQITKVVSTIPNFPVWNRKANR